MIISRATGQRHTAGDKGEIGVRASHFTEGGYCTLFHEGPRLKGRDGIGGESLDFGIAVDAIRSISVF